MAGSSGTATDSHTAAAGAPDGQSAGTAFAAGALETVVAGALVVVGGAVVGATVVAGAVVAAVVADTVVTVSAEVAGDDVEVLADEHADAARSAKRPT